MTDLCAQAYCRNLPNPTLTTPSIGTKEAKALFKEECTSAGSHVALVGQSGTVWGAAFRSTEETTNPIYFSIGHSSSQFPHPAGWNPSLLSFPLFPLSHCPLCLSLSCPVFSLQATGSVLRLLAA